MLDALHASTPRMISFLPHSTFLSAMDERPSTALMSRTKQCIECCIKLNLQAAANVVSTSLRSAEDQPLWCKEIVHISEDWYHQLPGLQSTSRHPAQIHCVVLAPTRNLRQHFTNTAPCHNAGGGTERHAIVSGRHRHTFVHVGHSCGPPVLWPHRYASEGSIYISLPEARFLQRKKCIQSVGRSCEKGAASPNASMCLRMVTNR